MKKKILVLIPLPKVTLDALSQLYQILDVQNSVEQQALFLGGGLADTQAVVTNGSRGLSSKEMDYLPELQIICIYGAGYENLDIVYAHKKGINTTYAPGANDETVADHALGMMLCLARGFHQIDPQVKMGGWSNLRGERPTLNSSSLGIVGLGNIGSKIAQRAFAFGMNIYYHTPRPKNNSWQYCSTILELAEKVNYLVIACPGGKETFHVINQDILQALGHEAYIINISRGSVIDTNALIKALENGVIAGAALDVFENEPHIESKLLGCNNILLTPHISGRSPSAFKVQTDILMNNLHNQFAGQALKYCL